MEMEKKIAIFLVIVVVIVIGGLFTIDLNPDSTKKSIPIEKEPKQDIVFLTFDQRVQHMQRCFDAAEKITTLAWGESTGSITIQLYLDTIGDVSKVDNKLDALDSSNPQLYIDLYKGVLTREVDDGQ